MTATQKQMGAKLHDRTMHFWKLARWSEESRSLWFTNVWLANRHGTAGYGVSPSTIKLLQSRAVFVSNCPLRSCCISLKTVIK